MVFLMGKADEHSTQHGEHVGLNEGYQQLKGIHEQQHQKAEQVQTNTHTDAQRPS